MLSLLYIEFIHEARSLFDFLFLDRKIFECQECGKVYKYREGLVRHKRAECGGKEPQFGCPMCSKRFKHRYQLRPHMARVHTIQALPNELTNSFNY